MLEKMSSIVVVGPRGETEQIVDTIYQEGRVHLVDISPDATAGHGELQRIDEASLVEVDQLLLKVNGLLKLLPRERPGARGAEGVEDSLRSLPLSEMIGTIRSRLEGLDAKTVDMSNRKADLQLTATTLERYAHILSRLQPIEDALPQLEGFEMTVLLLQKEYAHLFEQIVPRLREITNNQFEYVSAELDESTIAAITIFNKWYSREVHSFLFSQNVNEVRIPPDFSDMPIEEAIRTIRRQQEEGRAEIGRIDAELSELSGRWRRELLDIQRVLEEQRDELRVFSRFAHTDYTFVMKGWIPKSSIPGVRKCLQNVFGGRVALAEVPATPEEIEGAPISFANPFWARPFEFFSRLMGFPRYGEVDPIPFMAIFFPFFFGLIVADVGYGICILALTLFIRWRYPALVWLRELAMIFMISAIPTIIFGYLFGEFFGDFGEHMGWFHPVVFAGVTWNRMEAMIPLLVLAIAVGVAHVLLGLGLGVVNAVTRRNRRHLFEKVGMIAVILGILLVLIGVVDLGPPALLLLGAGLLVLGLPPLLYGGGVRGAVEIMGAIGNIMSYARLMAIGMASVLLAVVANELAGAVGTVLVGVLIAASLHLLNLVLALFSPFIQSTRLHLVEFNSKFYEGSGRPYDPFGYRPGG
ncbi:MAG: V-type ATP synthase subunit I [Methanospirillum sp.]|nr:V-type ATP synthase subunit I [Methanospirillum sp.]